MQSIKFLLIYFFIGKESEERECEERECERVEAGRVKGLHNYQGNGRSPEAEKKRTWMVQGLMRF